MEKTIANKMSLYDIVTLIVPSALIYCAWDWSLFSNLTISWVCYVAQFGLLLMIGLVLKGVSTEWSGFWFRNNADMIRRAEEGDNPWKDILCSFVCGPIMYLISPILFHRQNETELFYYYKKYELAYNNAYSGKRIEFLENQVAFLQSWSWALAVCLVGEITKDWRFIGDNGYNWDVDWWLFVIGIYACIVVMFILQKKIYKVVWESIEIEQEEKKQSREKK